MEEPSFVCRACDRRFDTEVELREHVYTVGLVY